jgi:hypothetical protein
LKPSILTIFFELPEHVLENGIVTRFARVSNRSKPVEAKSDNESASHHDQGRGQEEGEGMILEAGDQVHAEEGGDAGRNGHSESAHFHVQVHLDDPIAHFVLRKTKEILKHSLSLSICLAFISIHLHI